MNFRKLLSIMKFDNPWISNSIWNYIDDHMLTIEPITGESDLLYYFELNFFTIFYRIGELIYRQELINFNEYRETT